uniref:tRNA(Ile)-lysidine synthase n=1 Tax=Bangiopsis subsimplex TaxID=139980 RepID=A0A1C9CCU1_9RHOD|nr:tRNA(Ile)-lysidine synthase [Bangiopsis subsimplex]AOM66213.1 tRNA(Ile)-lysidine synthase [Bangiopsis subsimplex]ARO90426.1 tRNA(Ile)-lysidine synthase [Bangiopsis subsimplex]
MQTYMHITFLNYINTVDFSFSNAKILLAISGGKDSLALLRLMKDYQKIYKWKLGIIHCDHRWRTDSITNMQLIYQYAKELNIDFYLVVNYKFLFTESTVRRWRYISFFNIAIKYNFNLLMTAHTATDEIETFCHNLFRGTSINKLIALKNLKNIAPNLFLCRPLNFLFSNDIYWFCRHFYLPVWSDSTNFQHFIKRNRIRGELIPYLKQYFNPGVEKKIHLFLYSISLQNSYLQIQYQYVYKNLIHSKYVAIHICNYCKLNSYLQMTILQMLLDQTNVFYSFDQVVLIKNFIVKHNYRKFILTYELFRLVYKKNYIYFCYKNSI